MKRSVDTYQHRTIQDCAVWLFREFKPGGIDAPDVIHVYDFEKFQTVDEVFVAWSEANEISKNLKKADPFALPKPQ